MNMQNILLRDQYAVEPNRTYRGKQLVNLLNETWVEGFAAGEVHGISTAFRINQALSRLSLLETEILSIAAYSPKHQVFERLLDLARKEAVSPNSNHSSSELINHLAAELLKRLDIFFAGFGERRGIFLSSMSEITEDTRVLHDALLLCVEDDCDSLRNPEILQLKGRIAEWKRPESWNKPTGMASWRRKLAEETRRRYPKRASSKRPFLWRVGVDIYTELVTKPKRDDDDDDAMKTLANYYFADRNEWDKEGLRIYLNSLLKEFEKTV